MDIFQKNRYIDAFKVSAEDDVFLKSEEHTFLFFGATHQVVRMLSGKKENYTAGTIAFRELGLKPTDLMGQRCTQCKQSVDEVHTSCVGLNQNHVKQLFHETCFHKWFSSQDKASLKPYRFVRPRKRLLKVEESSFRIQINNGDKVDEYTFAGLVDIPYSSIASLNDGSVAASASTYGAAGAAPSLVPAAGGAGPSMAGAGPSMVDGGMSLAGLAGGGPGANEGMTMAAPSAGAGSLAGLAAAGGAGGQRTSTMIMCPHCTKPVMLSFDASKVGE